MQNIPDTTAEAPPSADAQSSDAQPPARLPALSPEDRQLLHNFVAFREDPVALATHTGREYLDIIDFTSRPEIALWINHIRTLRARNLRDAALAELESCLKTSRDPIERRRAATIILRATDSNRLRRPARDAHRRLASAPGAAPASPTKRHDTAHHTPPIPDDPETRQSSSEEAFLPAAEEAASQAADADILPDRAQNPPTNDNAHADHSIDGDLADDNDLDDESENDCDDEDEDLGEDHNPAAADELPPALLSSVMTRIAHHLASQSSSRATTPSDSPAEQPQPPADPPERAPTQSHAHSRDAPP